MKDIRETAADAFNRAMKDNSINLTASPWDFSKGVKCIILGINPYGEALSANLFDILFPSLESGIYYNYQTIESYKALAEHRGLRFFSTKKLSSEGEFIPLCKDLGLDGYWRQDGCGRVTGEHPNLMNDLFYKSFVSCPETNAEKLWDQFAKGGTGVRIKVRIDVVTGYPDFRRMAYQRSEAFDVLKSLFESFRSFGCHLIPGGLSRMPAYYQLNEFKYQNECRLLAKRFPGYDHLFPFTVRYHKTEQCNYIDCPLDTRTCPQFNITLLDVEKGPNCDENELNHISGILGNWWQKN
jgi:hypothetical protein